MATNCPNPACGEVVTGRYCESCGYNTETGQAPATGTVTLTLSADREHWERVVGSGEPEFPEAVPALTFELTGDQAILGRIRAGVQIDVDLPLTGAAADPAVSHYHCRFTRHDDGSWTVQDADSSNGTWVNDADRPLTGAVHRLADGDRIRIGAWTCLTVHLVPPAA